jgi:tryptophan-rich sensory protein
MNRFVSLVVFVVLVAAVAATAGQFMPGAWYAGLAKPTWTPPGWLFGPVWSVLYLMIAVAGWLVWRANGMGPALALWGAQLALNGIWSPVMFGAHRIGLALVVIVVLWVAIAAFIAVAWRVSRNAALLFVPYLAWVSFATALNFAIWRLNG